jgi:cell division protein FtsB
MKKKNKNIILRLAVFVFAIYVAVTLVQLQINIGQKTQERSKVIADRINQQIKNQELQRLLSLGNEADYIERVARDRLGFADPQERIFIDASGN